MIAVALVYLGAIVAVSAVFLWIIRKLRRRAARRPKPGWILLSGLLVSVAGLLFPVSYHHNSHPLSQLDVFLPAWQFSERHEIDIAASPDHVDRAIRQVSAGEIALFRPLVWLRKFGRPGPESILDAPDQKPILEVATSTTFMLLADEPGSEIVIGTAVIAPPGWAPATRPKPQDFAGLHRSGFALAAMNFRLAPSSPGITRVVTETRVWAAEGTAMRRFTPYWRIIYPGSALIRRMWLRAIKKRAERPQSSAQAAPETHRCLLSRCSTAA